MKHRPKHILEYLLLRGLAALLNAVPYPVALLLGRGLAGASWLVMRRRLSRCDERLVAVFGERFSRAARRRILRTAWRNTCFSAVELLRGQRLNRRWIERHYAGDGLRVLLDHVATGRGAVLALPHMGNWEVAGQLASRMGAPIFAIARDQKNPLTTAYLSRVRATGGLETVEIGDRLFARAVRRLRRGEVLAILPDIRAKTAPVVVDFLGGQAEIARGMALFARSANVPILPCILQRAGWSRHHWSIGAPIEPDASLDRDEDAHRMTQAVMNGIEKAVRAHPEQYFWFNKKWILGSTSA